MVGKLFQHYLLHNLTIHHDLENYLYHINFFFFLAMLYAFRILVPQSGMEPRPPAVEAPSPNHWTAKEFPHIKFFYTRWSHLSILFHCHLSTVFY